MSVKLHFLQKLREQQSAPENSTSKSQADIALFRQRMEQLYQQMDSWLAGSGLILQTQAVLVTDLLADSRVFELSDISVGYQQRIVRFTPLFLYGQGVKGCTEVTLQAEGGMTSLGRLFMRAGNPCGWIFNPQTTATQPGTIFDEEAFFRLMACLLP